MKYQQLERNACKHLWSKEEDQILLEVVGTGEIGKWAVIATEFNLRAAELNHQDFERSSIPRTNKQCQERWQNHVNPALQNNLPWSEEEHCLLFTLFKVYCHQWSKIGEKLVDGGFARRGGTNIKNYFYATIKRAIKQINSHIREHNISNKKRKSQLYHYAQKYVYKKRLSLEREILEGSSDCGKSNNNKTESDIPQEQQLRMVKELDQGIINKILLLAEWKGENKFVINREEDHSFACTLRNTLIDFVKEQTNLNGPQAVTLARNILQISKKCKRKIHRLPTDEQQDTNGKNVRERSQRGSARGKVKKTKAEKKQKMEQLQQSEILNQNLNEEIMSESFNQEQILERIMHNDSNKPTKPVEAMPLQKPSEQINNINVCTYNANPQPCRFILEQSSEFLYNSSCLEQKYGGMPLLGLQYQMDFGKGSPERKGGLPPLNLGETLNYCERNELQKILEPRDISEEHLMIDSEEACSHMAEFNFLSTIREVTPRDSQLHSQALDFDFGPFGTSNFLHQDGLDRAIINDQDHVGFLSANNLQLPWDSAEHFRSHQLKNRDFEKIEQPGSQMFSAQPFRHSWAHTQSHNDGPTYLFNSNYHETKGDEFSAKTKRNNFRPFYRQ